METKNKKKVNNSKKKNMNNEAIKTKTGIKNRTKVITGVVLAILVAVGIGGAIWYFRGGALGVWSNKIYVLEEFEESHPEYLDIKKEDVKLEDFQPGKTCYNDSFLGLGVGVCDENKKETKAIFTTNIDSFKRDLNKDKMNYLCPADLESKINSIKINLKSGNTINTNWIKNNVNQLKNIIKIKINDQDIDPNTEIFGSENLSSYFKNFDTVAWADLLRWTNNNPKALLIMNDASIVPIYAGNAEVRAGICGILSDPLDLVVSDQGKENMFNNVTTAGLGTSEALFQGKFTNGVLMSQELTDSANDIKEELSGKFVREIKGNISLINRNLKSSEIKLFFSFDQGKIWHRVGSLTKDNSSANDLFNFSENISQENASGLRWAIVYQFSDLTGDFSQKYTQELLNSDSFDGPSDIIFANGIWPNGLTVKDDSPSTEVQSSGVKKIGYAKDFFTPDLINASDAYLNQIKKVELNQVNNTSTLKYTAKNTGISNIQRLLYKDDQEDEIKTGKAQMVVGLPSDMVVDWFDYTLLLGKDEDNPLDPPNNDEHGLLDVNYWANPQTGQMPLNVKFSAVVQDGVLPYKYDWNFHLEADIAENFKYWLLDSDNADPSFVYNDPGLFSTNLGVRDSSQPIKTGYFEGPFIAVGGYKIKATPEFSTVAPAQVQFDIDATAYKDQDESYLNNNGAFEWDFGDGTEKSNLRNPIHTYQQDGLYKIILNISTPVYNGPVTGFYSVVHGDPPQEPNEPDLCKDISVTYRGADRVILKWKVGKDEYKDKDLVLKYGTDVAKDQEGKIVGGFDEKAETHYDKNKDIYYAVLRNLQGGDFSDKNDDGFVAGQKPYFFQVSLGNKAAEVKEFRTLNRFQAILYYYNLVFGDKFDILNYSEPDKSLRAGGPNFFYKPENGAPLSLQGVHFTLLNDRKFEEFNNRLQATARKFGNKKAVEELYRRVHDRIYDDNLEKIVDPEYVYWVKQIERDDENRIDILGAKFAISISPEAVGDISALPAEEQKKVKADQAYAIVLKRGGDQAGIAELIKLPDPKAMREKLAQSEEYNDRLKAIKDRKAQIEELYETLYARAADVEGVNYWDNTGMSIQDIKKEFLNSSDFANVAK